MRIFREYVDSAEPIGSNFLVNKYKLDLSAATIRNDMAELENRGLIVQPHTSAGRIPSEKGFEYFINNYLDKTKEPLTKDREALDKANLAVKKGDQQIKFKNMAKAMAELGKTAVVVGFAKNDVYYTGIANLFSQPEFANIRVIYDLSEVIDHLDEAVARVFEDIEETEIKIGRKNYFDVHCGSIVTKIDNCLFGMIGPMRMDYERNYGLINYVRVLLS